MREGFARFTRFAHLLSAARGPGRATLQAGVLCLAAVLTSGCGFGFAGNMTQQPRYDAYETDPTDTFSDDAASRHLVAGTVPRVPAYDGSAPRLTKAQFARLNPTPPDRITAGLLRRGRQRFNIWCMPCHGKSGHGEGMVVQRGFPAPPSLHIPRLRNAPDAHLFDVITSGLGNMPPYGPHVPVKDRWAIVAYVRALQFSQHAPADAAPPNQRKRLFAQTSPGKQNTRRSAQQNTRNPAGEANRKKPGRGEATALTRDPRTPHRETP